MIYIISNYFLISDAARRAAIELARQQAEKEARRQLEVEMHLERSGLTALQRVSRPLNFTYFELLRFFESMPAYDPFKFVSRR